jgi:hypothetical protein
VALFYFYFFVISITGKNKCSYQFVCLKKENYIKEKKGRVGSPAKVYLFINKEAFLFLTMSARISQKKDYSPPLQFQLKLKAF